MKQAGERKAGNPHLAFDVAGTGNVAWSRCCDTSQPKGRGNRENKLRPKPARQSPTLPVRGEDGNILTYSASSEMQQVASVLEGAADQKTMLDGRSPLVRDCEGLRMPAMGT